MTQDITPLRREITEIDNKLLDLLIRRLKLAKSVGEYKQEHGLPVEDPETEIKKRHERRERISKFDGNFDDLETIFNAIVKVSRQVQRRDVSGQNIVQPSSKDFLKVAIMGLKGSFTEAAARYYLKNGGNGNYTLEYPVSAEAVLYALEDNKADLGVFPIYNSIGGMVMESMYALGDHKISIEEIFDFDIRHCLHVFPGKGKPDIKRIMSHPQALKQCKGYLAKNFPDLELINASDTAGAAQILAENSKYFDTAVIAPKECAKMYGLELLDKNIQDQAVNFTKFIAARKGY